MANSKTSKLKRKPTRPIRLTERDKDVIQALHRYRFLTTEHLQKLTGTESRWAMNARLRLLYDHKYIDRPQAQKSLYSHANERPVIYALGNKGASFLSTHFDIPMPKKVYWTEKNRRIREAHIEHTLGISDFVFGIEIMYRSAENLDFITPQTLLSRAPKQTQRSRYPFRWKTRVRHNGKSHNVSLIPDYVFGIRNNSKPDSPTERFYFVEIDRGTMPVTRRDTTQTSFLRKLLSYADTYERELALKRFGMKGFQVLTVTTSDARIKSIQAEISKLPQKAFSANTFLFMTKGGKQGHFPFHSGWQNSKGASVHLF